MTMVSVVIEFASTHATIAFHTAIRPYRYQDAFNTTLCNDACWCFWIRVRATCRHLATVFAHISSWLRA